MNVKKIISILASYIIHIGVGLAMGVILNNSVIVNAEVSSGSMESTIMTYDRILGLKVAYTFSAPERFDVIVFKFPDDETSELFLKRVIGLPGEKVEIINGKVYIDDSDEPLDDSFINEVAVGDYGPFYVPDNCYFVLGDNRNKSHDSKDWINPYVAREKIIGKAIIDYVLFDHIRFIK